MTTPLPRPSDDPMEELRFALAEGDAETPPTRTRDRVLTTALGGRPAGRPVDPAPPITPSEGYRRAAAAVSALASTLTAGDWQVTALRDLDVQGVIGHLLGVERHLHGVLVAAASGRDATGPGDHVGSTQPFVDAQAGRPPAETLAEWERAIDENLQLLDRGGSTLLEAAASLYEVPLPIGPLLVVRAFELWTHADDIRGAVGRPLAAPDTSTLQLMTDLALKLLPAGMHKAGRPRQSRRARVVLTGPGGGVWEPSLDGNGAGPAETRIVADAVEFCRLVANRVQPDDFRVEVRGDTELAADVLAGANALALD
jgi:uncharacterized protein (TIGR03083 family)